MIREIYHPFIRSFIHFFLYFFLIVTIVICAFSFTSSLPLLLVPGSDGSYDFSSRPLKMTITMYKKKDKFLKKEYKLSVRQIIKGQDMRVGSALVDLANFCGAVEKNESLSLRLQECSDKGATLSFKIRTAWLKNAKADE
jgi:hypothetical protein